MSAKPVTLPRWADVVLLPALNVGLAFLASGLVVLAIGESPLEATTLLLRGALGHAEGIGFTLYYTTNFIFTGLAVAVHFMPGCSTLAARARHARGIGAAIAALMLGSLRGSSPCPRHSRSRIVRRGWAAIPGWLQAKRGSHVVITTIMFNFIASALLVYLLVDVFRPAA